MDLKEFVYASIESASLSGSICLRLSLDLSLELQTDLMINGFKVENHPKTKRQWTTDCLPTPVETFDPAYCDIEWEYPTNATNTAHLTAYDAWKSAWRFWKRLMYTRINGSLHKGIIAFNDVNPDVKSVRKSGVSLFEEDGFIPVFYKGKFTHLMWDPKRQQPFKVPE